MLVVPVAVVIAVGVLVAVVIASISGAVEPLILGDTGPVVRYGQVVARVLHDLSSSLTIGLLLVAAFLTPEARATSRRSTAAVAAAYSAGAWALTCLLSLVFTFSQSSGLLLGDPAFWSELRSTAWRLEITRLIVIELVMVVLLIVGAAWARTRGQLAWAFTLAIATLWPISFAGHGSSLIGHEQGMTGLLIHLVGISLWVGGLLAIVVLRPVLGVAMPVTLQRYSPIALACYVAVGASGVLFALLQADDLADLTSPYWLVLWLKVLALAVLGLFGYNQRQLLLQRDTTRPGVFARLALTELAVMGAAVGLGVALSRTPPPVIEDITGADPALPLTGFPTPEPFTLGKLFTAWEPMWLFLIPSLLAVGLYLVAVRRLHRRGDAWPLRRSVLWVIGWAIFIYATCGAPGMYGKVMFSMHMVMHMALMMAVPIFLVPAAPVTLALRALKARTDKTLGPRELILAIVHSRWAAFFVNPVVAAVMFFGSLIAFYYTAWFEWSLSTHSGHVVMVVHFLLTGYAFVWALAGTDPGPPKWPAPLRLMVLIGTLAAHAFFGLALMTGNWLLAPTFFKTIDMPGVDDLLADQQLAGMIAWGIGELPTVVLAMMVTLDWLRSDNREAKRHDRKADRDGDADLAAYNKHLADLAQHGNDPRPR
ncbi:cytochrome C oxidase assembly protein [Ornithinimicrobium ciconiae]|uniref:Cytochrome C oxidase assembly protein n=1 Tax=Ornithinimicrobium ciconiae TaxID=2594265 RepID=A0A516G750_9MICO|nr:cytochrome c oxidase assembly protein [Ornithinimicrobium ciconiae]QDO87325.1 cytochrome C oxidase assembly protein [Ornithinimicrobium ciconiae]